MLLAFRKNIAMGGQRILPFAFLHRCVGDVPLSIIPVSAFSSPSKFPKITNPKASCSRFRSAHIPVQGMERSARLALVKYL